VPPKIHIPSLTGRVRGVRRLFSTNILSLAGHVETRCIASPLGEGSSLRRSKSKAPALQIRYPCCKPLHVINFSSLNNKKTNITS
jgi:hypothetical protein